MEDLQTLVDGADVAALLRAVDGLASSRDWAGLLDLAARCRHAVEMGRQLWAVATHIDYRVAREAGPEHAARVLRPGAGRFALGPLPEVAATSHAWSAIAPYLDDPVTRVTFAHERVLHGEDLVAEPVGPLAGPAPTLRLEPWEPRYALPRYRDRSAEFPQPEAATRHIPRSGRSAARGEPIGDDEAVTALRAVVEPWMAESSGQVRAVAVSGDAAAAVSTLAGGDWGLLRLAPEEALALLQWAGASGGAYGHRRGGAGGRFSAWWAAAALAGLDWPGDQAPATEFAADLGVALAELEWHRWSGPGPDTGWTLRLAVADPIDGLAWAIDAVDRRDDDVAGDGAG